MRLLRTKERPVEDPMSSKESHHALGMGHGKENEAETPPSNHDENFRTTSSTIIDNNGASGADGDGMTELQVKSLVGLARSMSHASAQSSLCAQHPSGDINPFIDSESDPELNPHNENFNLRKWMKSILRITSRDPERYPRRTAGVSFRNLNVHGYGTAADYQADVANVWLKAYGIVKRLVGFDEKVRIDILRNFEGLVKSGEMLVVLGRPGR